MQGKHNISNTSYLAEPPPGHCLVPFAEIHTYCARAPGEVGSSQRRHAWCTGQELVIISPTPRFTSVTDHKPQGYLTYYQADLTGGTLLSSHSVEMTDAFSSLVLLEECLSCWL